MDFITVFRKERRYIYLTTALGILACVCLLYAVREFAWYSLLIGLLAIGLFAAMVLVIRNHHDQTAVPEFMGTEESLIQRLFDRYARRSVIWLLIVVLLILSIVLGIVHLSFYYSAFEILGNLSNGGFRLLIGAFFLIVNLRKLHMLNHWWQPEKWTDLCREYRFILISSIIFLIPAIGLCYGFERIFVLDISAFFTFLFAVWIVIYSFTRLNRFTYSTKNHARAVLTVAITVFVLIGGYKFLSRDIWLTQPYINTVPYLYEGESDISYDESTGVYTMTKPEGDFRILQLTDIHLGGSALSFDKDLYALQAVHALLKETKPDLVIITGDLSYPVGLSSFSFNNTAPVQQFAAFMRNTGIPWAFAYGNHDTENYAATDVSEIQDLYKSLSWDTSHTLLYPYVQPNIFGRNNQLIEIRSENGDLDQAIFVLDSNAYTGEGFNKYDYIHDDQVEWYRQQILRLNKAEGRTIPSLVFFHIPLQEYQTAYDLYIQGSDQVSYFFGDKGQEVGASEHPSKMFETAKELGSTTGFFCGHNHLNNYSVEYEGIRLTYGMSIDYLATPGIARMTEQRGGTLITIHDDGSSEVCQVPLISVEHNQQISRELFMAAE